MTLPKIFAIVKHLDGFNKGAHLFLHSWNNHAPEAISLILHGCLRGEKLCGIGAHCIAHDPTRLHFCSCTILPCGYLPIRLPHKIFL
jgi:hypothetical protein